MHDFFNIYDLNFNPIPLPRDELGFGFRGLDLEVSAIGQEISEQNIPSRPGNIITDVRDDDRDISIKGRIKAMNATDYRLKRDRVFAFFNSLGAFYVTEHQQGNKLMKVRVVDKYAPERPENMQTYAFLDIPLKIDGHPYWVSRFKTMD
ncbi:phage tail domain-containing protein, partial [Oceanobacillus neutriphilus]|uniref:phage tail domain-containing protein n=1 Tax=Oceanobacillus neutriphilus TaxID=531815 RepID=UPI00166C027C